MPGCDSGVSTDFLLCPPSFCYPCVRPPQPSCSRPRPEDCAWGPLVSEPTVLGSRAPWHPSSPPDDFLSTQPPRAPGGCWVCALPSPPRRKAVLSTALSYPVSQLSVYKTKAVQREAGRDAAAFSAPLASWLQHVGALPASQSGLHEGWVGPGGCHGLMELTAEKHTGTAACTSDTNLKSPATIRWGRPGRSHRRGVGCKGCQGSVGMLASMTCEHAGLVCNGRASEQERGSPGQGAAG